ncbi:zinc-binding alcohol dehydrogenase family protein [Mesorhizobium sp. B2-4-2]|uniref:zinc-binding alcohol dehydrogenase family protein n=1 Tax=Mesorhizobium sp. B2-4-2 TaxID=2589947 RepID=UPI00112B41CD|nr:zinc-binding alcohol dehydrogenase family protein [Mesorhizobium sp. B2-4-2]TPL50335.1 zinc-binding alcohol dehydrogenase family protein [Mesorhizobium sp. B2-4-2]
MMKAVCLEEPGKISLVELPEPKPGPGEVAVRMEYVGYCGSDLTSFRGLNPLISYPRVLGHEISGTISALGDGVSALAVGQSVTILPYFNCGRCHACRLGRPNACKDNRTMGVQREGAMASIIVVPAGKIIPVEGMRQRDLALIEPLAVGFHAVRRSELSAGETVVILGCGVIGLGALLGAVRRGSRVIAVDLSADKLAIAKALGATDIIDVSREDVLAHVLELTSGDGPQVVIEAVGAEATFRQAIDLVASCGRVVYVGYAKNKIAYDTKFFLLKEMDIRGSRGSETADFHDVIGYLKQRRDAGDRIVSRVVPIEEAGAAMQAWDKNPGGFTKIVVRIEAKEDA